MGLSAGDRTHRPLKAESHYSRLTDGTWIPRPALPAIYRFSATTFLNSPDHFFINITLSFPNQKPIKTFALIDSGANWSCISHRFADRHSLPRVLKDVPVPITAVDDRPIASGLVTHDVHAQILVNKHRYRKLTGCRCLSQRNRRPCRLHRLVFLGTRSRSGDRRHVFLRGPIRTDRKM